LLTSGKRQRLRVDLADFEGNSRYAEYDDFIVDSACQQYKLTSLGTYSGTAGQQLSLLLFERKLDETTVNQLLMIYCVKLLKTEQLIGQKN